MICVLRAGAARLCAASFTSLRAAVVQDRQRLCPAAHHRFCRRRGVLCQARFVIWPWLRMTSKTSSLACMIYEERNRHATSAVNYGHMRSPKERFIRIRLTAGRRRATVVELAFGRCQPLVEASMAALTLYAGRVAHVGGKWIPWPDVFYPMRIHRTPAITYPRIRLLNAHLFQRTHVPRQSPVDPRRRNVCTTPVSSSLCMNSQCSVSASRRVETCDTTWVTGLPQGRGTRSTSEAASKRHRSSRRTVLYRGDVSCNIQRGTLPLHGTLELRIASFRRLEPRMIAAASRRSACKVAVHDCDSEILPLIRKLDVARRSESLPRIFSTPFRRGPPHSAMRTFRRLAAIDGAHFMCAVAAPGVFT